MILRLLLTIFVFIGTNAYAESNKECEPYFKHAKVKKYAEELGSCYIKGEHLVILGEEIVKRTKVIGMKVFRIDRFSKDDGSSALVFEDVVGMKLADFEYEGKKHKVLIDDINEDGKEELVVSYLSANKNLRIYNLERKEEEYFGRLEFQGLNGKVTNKFHLNMPVPSEILISKKQIKIKHQNGKTQEYKSKPFAYVLQK